MSKLLVAVIFALVLSCSRTLVEQSEFSSEGDGRAEETLIKSHRALVWMGLQGQEPRYFEGKEMRGLGYDEYPVYALKNILRGDAQTKIIDWYGTSAKLEHELEQSTTSICTYPYAWKRGDLRRVLGQKSLVSLGLDFGTSQKRSILFLRKNLPRFARHLDASGDLSIQEVLSDRTLKTVLIQGVDYGQEVSVVFESDKNGEPQIKSRYHKNIELRVVRDHFQLAEMLKAGRFDYVLSGLLTEEQLVRAGLDKGEISTITYSRDRSKSIDDPSFTTYSVRCSDTPLTRKLMPTIDQWIKRTRNAFWKGAIEKHRKKVDRNYQYELIYWETPHWLFQKELVSGEMDRWAQARKPFGAAGSLATSGSLLKSKNRTQEDLPVAPAKRADSGRILLRNKTLALLNTGDLESIRLSSLRGLGSETKASEVRSRDVRSSDVSVDGSFNFSQVFKSSIALHLHPAELQWLEQSIDHFKSFRLESLKAPDSLGSLIGGEDLAQVETLLISPQGIPPELLKGLLAKISNVRSVRFLFPERAHSAAILEFLAQHPELRQLSVVRGFFKDYDVAKAIAGKKLEWLDLSGSSLEKTQLRSVLQEASPTLQTLVLVHQAPHTEDVIVPSLTQRKWPKLLYLDLRNDALSGSSATEFFARVTAQLETLRLEGNFLDPTHLAQIASRQKDLRVLVLSQAMLGATQPKQIVFPVTLETLIASSCFLSDRDLEGWQLPKRLKVLNLLGNTFSDQGYQALGRILAQNPGLEEFRLGRGHAGAGKQIQKLLFDSSGRPYDWLKQLRVLELSATNLTTQDFSRIAPQLNTIEVLGLADNLMTDLAVGEISKLSHLRKLDLGGNFISGGGLSHLLQSLPRGLQSLSLNSLLDSGGILGAQFLPGQLKEFSFAHNSMTKAASKHLAEVLPESLIYLDLAETLLVDDSVRNLIQHVPGHLTFLKLKVESSGSLMKALVESLPHSTQWLELTGAGSSFSPSDFFLPWHLDVGQFLVRTESGPMNSFYLSNWERSSRFISVLAEDGVKGFCEKLQSSSLKTLGIVFQSKKASLQLFAECRNFIPGDLYYVTQLGTSHELNLQFLKTQKYAYQFYSELAPPSGGGEGASTSSPVAMSAMQSPPATEKSDAGSYGILYLRGRTLGDAIAKEYARVGLGRVKSASLFDTDLGVEGLTQLIRAFHPELHHLTIQSSKLQYADVDRFLKALPKTLLVFKMQGNRIGEGGLEKVRSWVHETEKKRGYRMEYSE